MAELKAKSITLKNGKSLVLRSITPDDAQDFLIFKTQIPLESSNMLYAGLPLPLLQKMAEQLAVDALDSVSLNIGVFDNQRIVGSLGFRVSDPTHPWLKHIGHFNMMILKEFWGQGVAQQLLAEQDLHAQKKSIQRIEALVKADNERGLKLYEKSGFTIEGRKEKAAFIDGQFFAAYYIAKLM
ncbi:MAG: GNAT family N-acetyltransferase [Pseudobdellovibrionaceae bacterium]